MLRGLFIICFDRKTMRISYTENWLPLQYVENRILNNNNLPLLLSGLGRGFLSIPWAEPVSLTDRIPTGGILRSECESRRLLSNFTHTHWNVNVISFRGFIWTFTQTWLKPDCLMHFIELLNMKSILNHLLLLRVTFRLVHPIQLAFGRETMPKGNLPPYFLSYLCS